MRCLIAAVVLLTACSCASTPLVGNAEIAVIEQDYAAARKCEAARGPIGALDYDAASSLVHAQSERTPAAVAQARKDVAIFAANACHG